MAARVSALLRFELRYHARQLSWGASTVLLAAFALVLVLTGYGPRATAITGAYTVVQSLGLLSLTSVFALPMLAVHGALRDDEFAVRALVDSSPTGAHIIRRIRVLGVVLAALAALAVTTILLAAAPHVLAVPPERLTAFVPSRYAWAFVVIVVPNTVLLAMLLHTVAAVSRTTLATFVGAIGIYLGYMVTAMLVDSPLMAGTRPATPELLARVALLDPFGLSAFFEQTRYWLPAQRDARLLSLSGHLLINRLAVLAAAGGLYALLPRVEQWGIAWRARRQRPATAAQPALMTAPVRGAHDHRRGARAATSPAASPAAHWRATLRSTLTIEAQLLWRSWPLRALLVMWGCVVLVEAVSQRRSGEYGSYVLATSALMADAVARPLQVIGMLAAIFFAAEVVWRESLLKVQLVIGATAARSTAIATGKLIALLGVPLLFTLLGFGAAMTVHALSEGLPIEPRVYAAHAVVGLWPLLVLTTLTFALQALSPNRWVGLFAGMVLIAWQRQGASLGLEHPLWRPGSLPSLAWSDFDGFGAGLTSFVAFAVHGTLVAALVLTLALMHWHRGAERPSWWRALGQSGRAARCAVGALMLGVLCSTAGLSWATVVDHPWESTTAALARRAAYEQRWRRLAGTPQPRITDIALDVSIVPSARRATVHGTLALENRSAVAIDTLWWSPARDVTVDRVVVPNADVVSVDSMHHVWTVVLRRPLAPGATTSLAYALHIDRGGVHADAPDADVTSNGTFLRATTIVPAFGYQSQREIADPRERAAYGLGERSPLLATTDAIDTLVPRVKREGSAPAWTRVRTTIHTAPDQMAFAPGQLQRHWQADGQHHLQYTQAALSPHAFVIASGRYVVHRARTAFGPLDLWYHPAHGVNVAALETAAQQSVRILTRHFGPLPYGALTIVEATANQPFGAYAQPGMLFLTESRGMLTDTQRGAVDLLTRRVAHEVSHQWWGHTVDPLMAEGRLTIVEGLAKYAEQLVVDEIHGAGAVQAMLAFERDRYLAGRADQIGPEPTLLTVRNEPYIYYGKAALTFARLRERLGDRRLIDSLNVLIARERGPFGAANAPALNRLLDSGLTASDR